MKPSKRYLFAMISVFLMLMSWPDLRMGYSEDNAVMQVI